jgi:MoxR-like ATPase
VKAADAAQQVLNEVEKAVVGKRPVLEMVLAGLLADGHVLLDDVPGVAKTLMARSFATAAGLQFSRLQFTPDLLPADITGATVLDLATNSPVFRRGPIFAQLVLADEVNRAPAKTQSALLEAMQERQVTADDTTHRLPRPFLVIATQNPIESEGTYNLPEAQLDRFMFKLVADYPDASEEAKILSLHSRQVDINQRLENELQTVTSPEEIIQFTAATNDVYFDAKLIDYVNQIVRLTRQWPQLHLGASPRAGIALMQGARTLAAFYGRDYSVPDDVVQLALPALRHRVILTAEAEVEGHNIDELLTSLIRSIEVPRI